MALELLRGRCDAPGLPIVYAEPETAEGPIPIRSERTRKQRRREREAAFDGIADDLAGRSWTVMADFLGREACAALVAEINALRKARTLAAAGVGTGSGHKVRPQIRTDLIHWLDAPTNTVPQHAVWQALHNLRLALNRRLFLGLTRLEAHLAVFEPGGRYTKHVDTFQGTSLRLVSCVVYLNPAWCVDHGGELRIYETADPNVVARDVAPRCGTLACFLSADVAHEVLPTNRDRFSVTAWFSQSPPLR